MSKRINWNWSAEVTIEPDPRLDEALEMCRKLRDAHQREQQYIAHDCGLTHVPAVQMYVGSRYGLRRVDAPRLPALPRPKGRRDE